MPSGNDTLLRKEMADELFQMQTLAAAARSRSKKKGAADLTETEFLTLDLLARHGSMTVGELRAQISILPAQMSRVIRALEKRSDGPLIKCQINPKDKRKVDVTATKTGRQMHKNYKQVRLGAMVEFLGALSNKDCREFMRICRIIRGQLEDQLF